MNKGRNKLNFHKLFFGKQLFFTDQFINFVNSKNRQNNAQVCFLYRTVPVTGNRPSCNLSAVTYYASSSRAKKLLYRLW